MAPKDLLVEVGTEELPPKALKQLMSAFATGIETGLDKAGITHGAVHPYATPRRLAVWIEQVAVAQPERVIEKRGPALASAFDPSGQPTKATQGFAQSCGVAVEELGRLETDKGAWLVFRKTESGQPTEQLLPKLVEDSLATLPIPKRMRWGAGEAEFVRPVHWLVLLLGEQVIPANLLGLFSGSITYGHRFHHPEAITVTQPGQYAHLLETQGHVIVDYSKRQQIIRSQIDKVAQEVGGRPLVDESLLNEVTGLVEWPVALHGYFDQAFLKVPKEALISSMQHHQKYFPVMQGDQLLPYFIFIANLESLDADQIRKGNERVIRPRLSDAAFFQEQDQKKPLAGHLEALKTVVFQQKLGTLYDKAMRIASLSQFIASQIGSNPALAERAAQLAKCDLMSQMVGEFPELQGIMGRYYAIHDQEPDEVAQAIDEHYAPRFAGDTLPASTTGIAVALADRLDTLVGIFAIGLKPTGDKDPFGLRRSAIGALRLLIEKKIDLDLVELLAQAAKGYPDTLKASLATETIFDFMMDRLRGYYLDNGITLDTFEAVLANRPPRPYDFSLRLQGVEAFRHRPEAEKLAVANKRIRNILKQAGETVDRTIMEDKLELEAEKNLARMLAQLNTETAPLFLAQRYTEALTQLATLQETVDKFFDSVMVMADDPALKRNRFALVAQVSDLFLAVADIAKLQPNG